LDYKEKAIISLNLLENSSLYSIRNYTSTETKEEFEEHNMERQDESIT
jgi:hypothetical protein